MKKADGSRSVIVCFLLNLVLNYQLGLAAAILLVLHLLMDLPILLAWVVFAAWMLLAMVLTYLVKWGNESAGQKAPPKENKNPYSAGTVDAASGGRREDHKDGK